MPASAMWLSDPTLELIGLGSISRTFLTLIGNGSVEVYRSPMWSSSDAKDTAFLTLSSRPGDSPATTRSDLPSP